MTGSTRRRGAIYTRISKDDTVKAAGDRAVNCENQERLLRLRAEATGVDIIKVYSDDNLSAAKPEVTRPDYEALLVDIAAGSYDVVMAYDASRLQRQPRDLERQMICCLQSGTDMELLYGESDFSTPEGQLTSRIFGDIAAYDVAKIKRNTCNKLTDKALRGEAPGGRVGYGYRRVGKSLEIDESEAAMVREAAARIVAGETIYTIAQSWRAAGLTRRGVIFTNDALYRIMRNSRLIGHRVHNGAVTHTEAWPAILPPALFDQVQIALERRTPARAGRRPKGLLCGLAVCPCGAGLTIQWVKGHRKYRCQRCFKTLIVAQPLEDWMRDATVAAVDSDALAAIMADMIGANEATAIAAKLNHAEHDLLLLSDMEDRGEITREEWLRKRPIRWERIEMLKIELSRCYANAVYVEWAGRSRDLSDAWDKPGGLSVDAKRDLMAALFHPIVIGPDTRPRGTNGFDASRVKLRPRSTATVSA